MSDALPRGTKWHEGLVRIEVLGSNKTHYHIRIAKFMHRTKACYVTRGFLEALFIDYIASDFKTTQSVEEREEKDQLKKPVASEEYRDPIEE